LFVAEGLVMIAALATAGAVAAIAGATLFHQHLIDSGHAPDSPEIPHIEQAYFDASTASLLIAAVVATASALGITYYLSRRIRQPLQTLAMAAAALSQGQYQTRVTAEGAGPELDAVAETFNDMANKLHSTEQTRLRLLADLAHELRTPLANIQAYLEAVDDGVAEWDAETRALVLAETVHLTRLAGDLNEVSRAEEGRVSIELHVQSLAEIVKDAVDAHQPKFQTKGVELRLSIADDAQVSVDAMRIEQSMKNLLSNALRHTPVGGRVNVLVERPDREDIAVHVIDTGEGIRSDQLPHLFERFFRGDQARTRDQSGSGIGLTIAKALVEAHGGSLTASSAGTDQGAEFTMQLPVHG
jgi:signal transduction histidine kinase